MRSPATVLARVVAAAALLLAAEPAAAESTQAAVQASQPFDAKELVRRAEDAMRGESAEMLATMTITTPRWTREVRFRSWDDRRKDRAFTRILAPKKDKGTGFLRVDETFWTFLPRVERTARIPPSMMLQPWMGSDLTNDDLARDSSMVDDYEASALGERQIDGQRALGVKLIPHEDAPVVWARIDVWVRAEDYAPLRMDYYDELDPDEYEVVRALELGDIRQVAGRPTPHYWKVTPTDKPGQHTEIRMEEIQLDHAIPDEIFTQQNLKRAEAVR